MQAIYFSVNILKVKCSKEFPIRAVILATLHGMPLITFPRSVHGKTSLHSSHCVINGSQRIEKRVETISCKQHTDLSVVFPCTV